MPLEIIGKEIIGKIDNLQEKIEGKLPVNRLELLYLINSHGRQKWLFTNDYIKINECEATHCYDLSKLDTSKITNMSSLFRYSMFNGDINNWNTSNVTNMKSMFCRAKSFNQNINFWDISKANNMYDMFKGAESFNQPLLWDLSNIDNCYSIFFEAKAFEDRFNNGKSLPIDTNELKEWLKVNSDRMIAIDLKDREQSNLDSFFNDLNKDFIVKTINQMKVDSCH